MSSLTQAPYQQTVGENLILRTAADEHDVERVAEFNGSIHGPETVSMTRNLFIHHPNTQKEDLIFVEDERNGQVVSSLCLIPWTWHYEGVEIPTGEMGIVGTLEEYRRRGLVRAQVGVFERRLNERGCLLSQIQGIPYYYRQFGYEYALPLEGGLRLEIRHTPTPPDTPFTFRLATPQDIPTLMQLARSLDAYDMGTYAWQIHVPNLSVLLHALISVFERRIAESPFAGLTKDVRINLYHETILLRFEAGKLVEVVNLGFAEGGDVRAPPLQFIPLVLGYRTVKELQAAYPDVSVASPWQLLADTLFPKVTSFIHTIY